MHHVMTAAFLALAALLFTVVIAGCAKNQYVSSAIDDEAAEKAEIFWANSFSKCGDSFYGARSFRGSISTDPMIYQFKDPVILTYHNMTGKVITEADKLNGFEWQGTTRILCKVHRHLMSRKWSDWVDCSTFMPSETQTSIRKVKGTWEFGIKYGDYSDKYLAIPCSQVPS